MEEIKQWFESDFNFSIGVELYKKHAKVNINLLRMFTKETPLTKEKLKYELRKLCKSDIKPIFISKTKENLGIPIIPKNPIISIQENIEKSFEEKNNKNAVFFHHLPPELQPELLKANTYWKENCLLKVQLNSLPADAEAEALELQFKISDNWKANALCWKKIDHYLEFRQLPKNDLSEFDNLTPAQLLRKQQLLYQNISKMKKRLEENKAILLEPKNNQEKARLEKLVAKQNKDIISKEEELANITKIIDGKD